MEHTSPLFYISRIVKIYDSYKFSVANYIFDHNKEARFQRSHMYSTKNASILLPPHERLTSAHKLVLFLGCQIWNVLPSRNKETRSRNGCFPKNTFICTLYH